MGCCSSTWRQTSSSISSYHILKNNSNLVGKVAIVTGSTRGIGFETAKTLASVGCHVIVSGRDPKVVEETKKNLLKSLLSIGKKNHYPILITAIPVDLSSFSSIRNFCSVFLSLRIPLHFLILNAGIMKNPFAFSPKYEETVEGMEQTMGVNHMGHFLIFLLLQKRLRESRPARVIVVSSVAHGITAVPPYKIYYKYISKEKAKTNENNNNENNENSTPPSPPPNYRYDPWSSYAQSKLANLLFATEANNRFRSHGITAYSVHPGVIFSNLFDETPCSCCMIFGLCTCVKTVKQGAATTVYCCLAQGLEEYGGEYFVDSTVVEGHVREKMGEGEGQKLWEWSEKFVREHSTVEQWEEIKGMEEMKVDTVVNISGSNTIGGPQSSSMNSNNLNGFETIDIGDIGNSLSHSNSDDIKENLLKK